MLNDNVYLRAGGGTPEIHTGLLSAIDLSFDQLAKHDSFKERPAQGAA